MTETINYEAGYKSYKARYESLCSGISELEKKISEQQHRMELLEAERKQWEVAKVMQQAIIQQAIGSANTTSQTYLNENQGLRQEVSRLKEENSKLLAKVLSTPS